MNHLISPSHAEASLSLDEHSVVICTQYLLASKPFNQIVCNFFVKTLVYLPNKR